MMNHGSQAGVNGSRPPGGTVLSADGRQRELVDAVSRAIGAGVSATSPCAGGDINRALRLELDDGRRAFVKFRPGAPAREFSDEAAGLAWLAEPGALAVPRVLAVVEAGGSAALVLEWIEAGRSRSPEREEDFGRGLAAVHASGAERHGGRPPGAESRDIRFAGASLAAAPGDRPDIGFAELYSIRIEDLARQAVDAGGLDPAGASTVSRLAGAIERYCGPPVSPARLHGDLWSGNVMSGEDGRSWLIDPAAYGGHPEVDLAMLELFGSPTRRFYEAYDEVLPLPDGRRERIALWQVQPLLVHAALFGGHYGNSARAAAERYLGR